MLSSLTFYNKNMKTYIIKITDTTGLEHHHLIEDENDLQILKAVLNRVEKMATQKVNELSKAAVISTCQPTTKTCDCSRKHDYTADFVCDGNCK